MPIKKKEEVCGKPNQYNLQTLEYDWKELPDTHFQVPQQQPRIRNYSLPPQSDAAARAGGAAGAAPRLNPITHQPIPTHGVGTAYTPLPSPSKPAQEDVRSNTPHGRYGNNNRKDNVADLFSDAAPSRSPPPLSAAPPTQSPLYPQDDGMRAIAQAPRPVPPPLSDMGYGYGYGGGVPPALRNDGPSVIPWSHEDIRRVVTSNALEAQRSYLR